MTILSLRTMLACGVATTSVLALGAGPAQAQSRSDEATEIGEVLVTARKREERLVDVALAASVFSGDDILQRGTIADPSALLSQVPGVQFNNVGSPTTSELSIRGSGT